MTLNLDAFKAHVNITISLNDSLARSATFLETLCFHIVDDAMIGGTSVTTSIFTPSNPEITLDDTAILPSDTAYQKMDAFMATFLNGGGKSAMFLITTSTLQLS